MAWDVNNIFLYTKWLTNKNRSGSISATDLFYQWNSEQKAYMSDLLGRFQMRNNGKEGVNTGLIENEVIITKLAPFTKTANLVIATGTCDKPSDFAYRLALRINGVDCYKINQNQIASVNASVIDAPSVSNNLYYFYEVLQTYSFLPTTVTAGVLDYIATPTDIVWGYTLDADGRQVYSSGTSVQPLWQDLDIIDITKRALKSLGVHFKDADFANFGNSNIVTGD